MSYRTDRFGNLVHTSAPRWNDTDKLLLKAWIEAHNLDPYRYPKEDIYAAMSNQHRGEAGVDRMIRIVRREGLK